MNWDIFLLYLFAMVILKQVFLILGGLINIEKDKKLDASYSAFSAIHLVVLILMWFWT